MSEIKDGNATYRTDKYRIPTGYNWLPATGETDGDAKRCSVNKVYSEAKRVGKFSGGFSEFLAVCGPVVQKFQGEDKKIKSSDVPSIITLLPDYNNDYNYTGSEDEKVGDPVPKATIWGVRPWVFYTGATLAVVGLGYGVYSLLKGKK